MTTEINIEQLHNTWLERAMIAAERVGSVSTAIELRIFMLPYNPERLRAWMMVLQDETEQIGIHLATAEVFAPTCIPLKAVTDGV